MSTSASRRTLPSIDPMPPRAPANLPWIGSAVSLLRRPTGFLKRTREALGDTFVVDVFGYRLFFVFSAAGVRRLYALPEKEASFGLATFTLVFKHKIPLELAMGRRNRPHDLFGSQEIESYLEDLEAAVGHEMAAMGSAGTFEAFSWARRLGHRLGLGCWAGAEAASPRHLDRLVPLFDRLDTSDSFVRPWRAVFATATGKRIERRAMRGIEAVIGEILDERERSGARRDDFLDHIARSWSDVPPGERAQQVARDVMIIHMGAQSNLYAALAWSLVDLLLRPELLARVLAGDDALLERCANESIRMAQNSLTLRQVMQPLEVDDGVRTYRLAPGTVLATMLSVNNTTAAPGLDTFDPDHYEGRKLSKNVPLEARELVSTFGHGRHSCPAQRFSISAIRIALRRLLERYELEPAFSEATPRPRQLGAVARASKPCRVRYRVRGRNAADAPEPEPSAPCLSSVAAHRTPGTGNPLKWRSFSRSIVPKRGPLTG
jgi:cytochrome P450